MLVIGSGGSGKTAVARAIAARTGLPLIHLDQLYWRPGWVPTSNDEWDRVVAVLIARDAWVMDGNYGRTLPVRMAAADTIVFLDLPRRVCLQRALGRQLRYAGRTRPDMAPGCPERFSLEFLRWIWSYRKLRRPAILARLAELRPDQRAVVLTSAAEVREFLASLGPAAQTKTGG